MTPAIRAAIEILNHIAEKLSDTVNDDLAQAARHAALRLLDEPPTVSDADRQIEAIRRIIR